jgi:IMP cyclohydrolase
METIKIKSDCNVNSLRNNSYPGRGIIMGMSPDSKRLVQIYWIMGRSQNSRNRIFVNENGFIKTEVWDASKVEDPSLIIYYAAKHQKANHIVSNGNQTDTVYKSLECSETFEDALSTRKFEPDVPNYTPRISGLIDLYDNECTYKLSIIKSIYNNPSFCERHFYYYEKAIPGFGHCIHTYSGDANPLPSFNTEPFVVPIFDDIQETANFYWDILNENNKISIFTKFIDIDTNEFKTLIINKNK